jgi:hypothetical protein
LAIDLAVGNYTIQIQAYDGLVYSTYMLEPLEIVNTAPTFSGVSLDTVVAWENSTITALPSGFSDVNTEDEGFWAYEWLVNGSMVLQGTTINLYETITINGTDFSKHDLVSCRVRAIDNHGGVSAPITSAAITISNSMPVIIDLAIGILGSQYLQNETLFGQASAFDADGDVVQYTFLWYVAPGGVNFSYVYTGSSLFDPNRTYFQAYDSIIICAIPSDGEVNGTPVNSSMVEIQNSKPGICTAAWLDTTGGAFIIPIVRWLPAFDYDGGFQTYEIYIGTKPFTADLLEMSRAASPYTALCYRYLSNQSIYRGTIYVHVRAIDEFQLPSDEVLVFACTWDVPEEREGQLTQEQLLLVLGLSVFAIVGGLAIAFSAVKRVEHSIDVEIPGHAKKLPVKKGKKEAGKPSTSYQETPAEQAYKDLPAVPKEQTASEAIPKLKKLVAAPVEEFIPRKIDDATEKEVKVDVMEEKCIVCENKLQGTAYHCPHCSVKYCLRCASTLAERHEPCWSCKNHITLMPSPLQPAPATTAPHIPPPASTTAAAAVVDYHDVLKERMGRVKIAINSKDYTNACAWLQEMIVIAEKNGDLDLAGNYKKKFEEVLKLSVD